MQQDIAAFVSFLTTERGFSANTAAAYESDLRAFAAHLVSIRVTAVSEIQPPHVLAYVVSCKRDCRLAASTIGRRLSAIRSFCHFLVDDGRIGANPSAKVAGATLWQTLPDVLSVQEVEAMLSLPVRGKIGLRNRAIIELIYATGARAAELCGLTLDTLNLNDRSVRYFGKGSKERMVPIAQVACQAVRAYLDNARPSLAKSDEVRNVFLGRYGKPMRREDVWRIVAVAGKDAGIKAACWPLSSRTMMYNDSGG